MTDESKIAIIQQQSCSKATLGLLQEMLNHAFEYSRLFGRTTHGNNIEYIGIVRDVPFQCEPRATVTYYLFKLDNVFVDCGVSKDNCSISLSSNRESYRFTFKPTDVHTELEVNLLWRITQLVSAVNIYITIYGRVRQIADSFDLGNVVALNKRFRDI